MGDLDAVIKRGNENDDPVFVFRGKYVWPLARTRVEPHVRDARPIRSMFQAIDKTQLPDFIDGAACDHLENFYLFKYPQLFHEESKEDLNPVPISSVFKDPPASIDAASYVTGRGLNIMSLFSGTQTIQLTIH